MSLVRKLVPFLTNWNRMMCDAHRQLSFIPPPILKYIGNFLFETSACGDAFRQCHHALGVVQITVLIRLHNLKTPKQIGWPLTEYLKCLKIFRVFDLNRNNSQFIMYLQSFTLSFGTECNNFVSMVLNSKILYRAVCN